MNKSQIKSILLEQSRILGKLMKNIDANARRTKTDGSLYLKTSKGVTRYYLCDGKGHQSYLGEKDADLIGKLAVKYYGTKLMDAAEAEKAQIDSCIRILDSKLPPGGTDKADIDLVYGQLPEPVRSRVNPSVVTDDGYVKHWKEEKYDHRWLKGEYKFETKGGQTVRSKSELIIANMLYDAGVPYRYEETRALCAELGAFHNPDFTVLNARTRQEFVWEHFGMMDKEDYRNDAFRKLSEYMMYGYFPGKNLIVTYETSTCPLRTEDVTRLIDEFLK